MKWQIGTKVRNTQTGRTGEVTNIFQLSSGVFCDIIDNHGVLDRSNQAGLEASGWRAIG